MTKRTGNTNLATTVDLIGHFRTDRLLVTASDAARLRAALHAHVLESPAEGHEVAAGAELLAAAMRSAIIVPPERIPRDVVTMRSRCVLEDETGSRRAVVLVYPEEEAPDVGRVSVLTPLGVALLGLSEGSVVGRTLPSGRIALLEVQSVEYQPEDAKEFHL
jgi:regulator of nucleoside diphosphate kinase